jgi:membrane protease YdiL (CAAX protease family)
MKKSVLLSCIGIPVMLVVMFLVYWMNGISNTVHLFNGILSFFESITEEIYFRGVLLLYLWKKTNLPVAYGTALGSFVLSHPQHFISLFLISTIVQAILTAEIARRSKNIIGSWFVHGCNRFASIVLFPFLL